MTIRKTLTALLVTGVLLSQSVRAAAAARIFTVAVNTGPLPDSMLWDAGADIVEHSMDDFRKMLLTWKI